MGGGARALVRQLKTAVIFGENCRNQAALKVLSGFHCTQLLNKTRPFLHLGFSKENLHEDSAHFQAFFLKI